MLPNASTKDVLRLIFVANTGLEMRKDIRKKRIFPAKFQKAVSLTKEYVAFQLAKTTVYGITRLE